MESDPMPDALLTHGLRDLHGRTTGPTRRSTKGQWTKQEDELLCKAVQRFKGKNWKRIAECFKDRTDVQCLHRWQKVLNPELVKGPWTKEEDEELVQLVGEYGPKKWSTIAQRLTGRIGKQCRERWHNHLNPAINKEAWTQEEELMLIQAHRVYGNKWAELTKFLRGRTDNAIKNHWNSAVKKKLDAYMASGLLEQFQGLPCASTLSTTPPPTATSSRTTQQCGEGGDVEEISECSQASTFVRCSHSNDDMAKPDIVAEAGDEQDQPAKAFVAYDDDTQPAENIKKDNNLYSDSSNIIEQPLTCSDRPSSDEFHNLSSLDLSSRESEFMHYDHSKQVVVTGVSSSTSDVVLTVQMLTSENDCPYVIHLSPADGSLFYQQSNSQTINADTLTSQSPYSDLVGTQPPCGTFGSECNHLSNSTLDVVTTAQMLTSENDCPNVIHPPPADGSLFYQQSNCQNNDADTLNSQLHCSDLVGTQPPCGTFDSECNHLSVGLGHITNYDSQFFNDQEDHNVGGQDQADPVTELVSADVFSSGRQENGTQQQQEETRILSYETPCFPSPFFSCDLIQSGGDDDEFSPLGIRKLMMSTSINCFSPCRLWDSPSRDHTSEAVLKTAAKTFTSTPSILKKRHRDLLSPLSEKPYEKRLSFNNDEKKDKENLNPAADEMAQREGDKTTTVKPLGILLEQNLDASVEHLGICGETPFKKSLESPSAWKSPWFSFVPGPRIDTDITIEDIGYFMSPSERSYDALGLMKLLREHTASAYANAQEVLGDETPDSILKKRFLEKRELSRQASNMLTERRFLDFSECASPKKGGEQSAQNSSGVGFSSPSAYLLKSCR